MLQVKIVRESKSTSRGTEQRRERKREREGEREEERKKKSTKGLYRENAKSEREKRSAVFSTSS